MNSNVLRNLMSQDTSVYAENVEMEKIQIWRAELVKAST